MKEYMGHYKAKCKEELGIEEDHQVIPLASARFIYQMASTHHGPELEKKEGWTKSLEMLLVKDPLFDVNLLIKQNLDRFVSYIPLIDSEKELKEKSETIAESM